MGIKRCPSFSKRPGFPCGLRVLLVDADDAARSHAEQQLNDCSYSVTLCSSSSEAVARLSSGSYDVLLADKTMVGGSDRERQQLIDSCKHLPCILMGQDTSPADIVAGVKLGAVDFLQKPLSPLKVQNIWQHTVRKMMGNMTIKCKATGDSNSNAAVEQELAAMSAIMEEDEEQQQQQDDDEAAAALAARNSTSNKCPAASNAAVALATSSSFYEPTKCVSRTSSSAAAEASAAGISAPDSPAAKIAKHTRHGQVHSCPSTRSLNSMASCYSTLQLAVPASPASPTCTEGGDATTCCADLACEDPAAEAATTTTVSGRQSPAATGGLTSAGVTPSSSPAPCAQQQQQHQQRTVKKAVRHPTPCTPASKPPLAGKPSAAAAAAAAAAGQQAGVNMAPGATAAGPLPSGPMGFTSVPLPTGLGPLPQGCVWGMPMCPLARAPGIVPPAGSAGSSSGAGSAAQQAAAPAMPAMPPLPWMMPPMFAMPPFMPGFPGMGMPPMPMPPMPMGPYGPGMMAPGAFPSDPSQMQQQMMMMMTHGMMMQGGQQQMQYQQPMTAALQQHEAPAPCGNVPSGAGLAAALNAQLAGIDACMANPVDASGGAQLAGIDVGDAFDFMLGDISAEDDLDVSMKLLDGELTQLEKDGLKLPAELQELQALEQVQQAQQLAQHSQRVSFDCATSSHQRQRVSFDCSTASTTTGARVSFDCSAASTGTMQRLGSQRVSFEVNCCNAGKGPAAAAAYDATNGAAAGCNPGAAAMPARLQSAQSGSAGLLGSLGDLFAACSGGEDSCSDGEPGMTRVDSCGMLADLHTLFGSEDDGCNNDDGCSPAAVAAAASLFGDSIMDDTMPLELAMKKSSSLTELINAGLPALTAN